MILVEEVRSLRYFKAIDRDKFDQIRRPKYPDRVRKWPVIDSDITAGPLKVKYSQHEFYRLLFDSHHVDYLF